MTHALTASCSGNELGIIRKQPSYRMFGDREAAASATKKVREQ